MVVRTHPSDARPGQAPVLDQRQDLVGRGDADGRQPQGGGFARGQGGPTGPGLTAIRRASLIPRNGRAGMANAA